MVIGVIFAGGVGSRMHSKARPKQFLEMHKKPIIIHTLEHFQHHSMVDAIVVVCVEGWIDHLDALLEQYHIDKVKKVIPGGSTGQESIYKGLCAAEELADGDNAIVLIHDGVRPLISEKVITDNIESVRRHGSAITTAVVAETILVVDPESSQIDYIPSRKDSRVAKAPQSFYLNDIITAHRRAISEGRNDFIDSCSMMQHYGAKLYLIDGPQENIKITTPLDFYTMRAILDAKENAQIYGYNE